MDAGFGTNYKIVRSTFDTAPAAWVFVRNSPSGPVKGVLHLTPQQAVDLMFELDKFVREADNERN